MYKASESVDEILQEIMDEGETRVMEITEFIDLLGLTIEAISIESRPDEMMDDMAHHWEVTIKNPDTGGVMTTYYSGGSAVTDADLPSVLNSLMMEGSDARNYADAYEFASEFERITAWEEEVFDEDLIDHDEGNQIREDEGEDAYEEWLDKQYDNPDNYRVEPSPTKIRYEKIWDAMQKNTDDLEDLFSATQMEFLIGDFIEPY